jgi:putative transposase
MVFRALNRANARARISAKEADCAAFEQVMKETLARKPMRIRDYAIMPNHWHLVLWPERDGNLARFMYQLAIAHVRRWHLYRKTIGCGHLCQGTHKSFPVESDEHLLTVLCYVERNALRAELAHA